MSDRLYWNVPGGMFAIGPLSDAALAAGITAGTHQNPAVEQGDALINGLGLPAPPLVMTGVVLPGDPMAGEFHFTGGHANAQEITYIFGDGTSENRELPGSLDAHHTYANPGKYAAYCINDFGQKSKPVLVIVPYVVMEDGEGSPPDTQIGGEGQSGTPEQTPVYAALTARAATRSATRFSAKPSSDE